ncbi:MAG: TonB-dependent receptor [Bacteroidetes bacterium]|nr:TonB-dependent receptor [Bacteroidota bacterium]MBS1649742.1 TonB-dependent receptor [Bacteroidota bacterium]
MKIKLLIFFILFFFVGKSQESSLGFSLKVFIQNEIKKPLPNVVIEIRRTNDSSLIKNIVTNNKGIAEITKLANGTYYFFCKLIGYTNFKSGNLNFPSNKNILKDSISFQLFPSIKNLGSVTVASKKPLILQAHGKTVINVDAAITNTGLTIMEVLAKSPGVIVDKNGTISLKGKQGVLVLIDDKPTYLSAGQLNNLLSSMNASLVEQIELISNPSAKYDASGNAGIINIKMKKNVVKGFNGIVSLNYGQGKYARTSENVVLNFKRNKFNIFFNYGFNANKDFNQIYALRNYLNTSGIAFYTLEQPSYLTSNGYSHAIRTGIDYNINSKTIIGASFTGSFVDRTGASNANAIWKQTSGTIDSTINTTSNSTYNFKSALGSFYLRHTISKTKELSFDFDLGKYNIDSKQNFLNQLIGLGGYTDANKGNIPSNINIVSAKADYTDKIGKQGKFETGFKTAFVKTDNIASYEYFDGSTWKDDLGKSNHFLYNENINAIYATYEQRFKRFSFQVGLRYEHTHYDAHQLGNAIVKDSAFNKNYSGLFPSGYISYMADSNNTFTVTFGRRIDRPAFQKLNPFVFLINKYTYQTGNPYFSPQDTWNFGIDHQYKQWLTSSVSFSIIKDYFSQLFINGNNNIFIYTEGNVGKMYNFSLSETVQLSPLKWWTVVAQALFNYKEFQGYISNNYTTSIPQLYFNITNQFKIGKKITAELSGNYITNSRNDLQELLYPTGQISTGFAMPIMKKRATVKLSIKDIFYTQVMEGLTSFNNASEYFKLLQDSRKINFTFIYRFGKQYKTPKRSAGAAGDEIQRVGG